MRSIPKLFALCVGVFLLVPDLAAQDTASLTGTVRDVSGAVVPGAGVVLKSVATGITRRQMTNSAGEYVAAAMHSTRGSSDDSCCGASGVLVFRRCLEQRDVHRR